MPPEPATKRTAAFVDGQNLFWQAKYAFGYAYPNYDPLLLAQAICGQQGWSLTKTYFYTGVSESWPKPSWHAFWHKKLAVMGTRGIEVFSRPIRYGKEKGIDVRLALDAVRCARSGDYDVILIFSQDQDLSEAADDIKEISIEECRWIKVASAYPVSANVSNTRGINGTDWIPIDKATYDPCIDPADYRPSPSTGILAEPKG